MFVGPVGNIRTSRCLIGREGFPWDFIKCLVSETPSAPVVKIHERSESNAENAGAHIPVVQF